MVRSIQPIFKLAQFAHVFDQREGLVDGLAIPKRYAGNTATESDDTPVFLRGGGGFFTLAFNHHCKCAAGNQ